MKYKFSHYLGIASKMRIYNVKEPYIKFRESASNNGY